MSACEQDLEQCLQRHTGMTCFAEYVQKVGNEQLRTNLQHPPLPPGFVDAAELRMLLLARKEDTPEARKLSEVRQKLEAVEQVLTTVGNKGLLTGIERERQQLLGERERLGQTVKEQRQLALNKSRSLLMPNGEPATVMDSVGFRIELSTLLQRKLDLLCEHRLAVAERILKIKVSTVTCNPELVERINDAADRFQAKIAEAQGYGRMGAAAQLIQPLRHEYAWHAHFPSLVHKIPESMPSKGDPTQWLIDLSIAIEKDRAAALAGV